MDDTAVIKGLRITLLDSANLPVLHYGRPWHLFRPNGDPVACDRGRHGFPRGEHCCFPFAMDKYALVVPHGNRTETMRVLIQGNEPGRYLDKRHEHWPEGWAQQLVPLTAFDSYPLCGTYDEQVYPAMVGRPAYHAVDVILQRR